MVLKTQPMSDDMAARVAREQTFQVETEARKWEGAKDLVLRQWCVEKAIQVCGTEGVVWHCEPPIPASAVVPIAEGILRFITGGGDNQ